MKNIRVVILGMMVMIVATVYAIDDSQGPIHIFTIPLKNYNHQCVLDIMRESSQNGARAIMADDGLILAAIRAGCYDLARQMRMRSREQALQLQEHWRQQAQQELLRWGYLV